MPIEYSPGRIVAGRFYATTPLERARHKETRHGMARLCEMAYEMPVAVAEARLNDFGELLHDLSEVASELRIPH